MDGGGGVWRAEGMWPSEAECAKLGGGPPATDAPVTLAGSACTRRRPCALYAAASCTRARCTQQDRGMHAGKLAPKAGSAAPARHHATQGTQPRKLATATHQHRLAHAAGGRQAGVQHALGHVAACQDLINCQPPLQGHQLLIRFCGLQETWDTAVCVSSL